MPNSENITPKDKILVLVESKEYRAWLNEVFSEKYTVLNAANSTDAMNIVFANSDICLAVVDSVLCEMDGFEFFKNLKDSGLNDSFPSILAFDTVSDSSFSVAVENGFSECVSKRERNAVLLNRADNLISRKKISDELKKLKSENTILRIKDHLTGVYNYEGFKEKAIDIIRSNPGLNFEIAFFDIKSFKYINELFGIETGNTVLKHWTEHLQSVLGENEILGRYNSDRFVILTVYDPENVVTQRFADARDEMAVFLDKPGKPYKIDFATGIYYLTNEDKINPEIDKFIGLAKIAHEVARHKSGTCVEICSEDQWKQYLLEQDICSHLEDALKNGEITVWLQPQFDYITRKISGAEALCRWNHPKHGQIRPDIFIKALENSGQIYQLDQFVWETVCKLLKELHKKPYAKNLSLSINVSRKDFNQDKSPVEVIEDFINKYSLTPQDLHIEITESAHDDNNKILIERVQQFANKGFVVELDDFGSGYSSINRLQDLCIGILKLDKDFVQCAEHSDKSRNILETIVELGKKLEFILIAEGVENETQARLVGELGCHIIQGFLLGKPMPIDEFCSLLENNQNNIVTEETKIHNARQIDEEIRIRDEKSINMDELVDALPVGVFRYEAEGEQKFSHVNNGLLKLLGYSSREQIKEKLDDKFINMVYEKDREAVTEQINRCIYKNGYYDYCEYRIVTADNNLRWVCDYGHLVTDKYGKKWYDVVVCDIENFKNKVEKIDERNKLYDSVIQKFGLNIFVYSFADDCANVYITNIDGTRSNRLIENFSTEMVSKEFIAPESADVLRTVFSVVKNKKRKSGNFNVSASFKGSVMHNYYCDYTVEYDDNNEPVRMIGTAKNIDYVNSVGISVNAKSDHDKMTGLLNRSAVIKEIERAVRKGRYGTLALVEISNYNDLYSTSDTVSADTAVTAFADALKDSFRKTDIIGRYSDDKFIIYLRGVVTSDPLNELFAKMHANISKINADISTNSGYSVLKKRTNSVDSGVKRAEESLRNSKAAPHN